MESDDLGLLIRVENSSLTRMALHEKEYIKFYKELEFMPVRQNAMMFGTLVHETIEDIHRAACI